MARLQQQLTATTDKHYFPACTSKKPFPMR